MGMSGEENRGPEGGRRIEVRRAGMEDLGAVREVMRWAAGAAAEGQFVSDGAGFIRRHMGEEGWILTASENGRIGGFLILHVPGAGKENLGRYLDPPLAEAELPLVLHMESAAVCPDFQGLGLQARLMEEAERQAAGFRYLMGTVHPDNKKSLASFLKLGYRRAAERQMYGGLPRYVMYKENPGWMRGGAR